MKKAMGLLLVLALVCGLLPAPVLAAAELIFEHSTDKWSVPEYSENSLQPSGMAGYDKEAAGSRCGGGQGSWGKWTLSSLPAAQYDVYVYKVVRPEEVGGNDTDIQVTVSHNGKQDTFTYDQTGSSEWVKVGNYDFQGNGLEFVELKKTTPTGQLGTDGKAKMMQVDAVKLVRTGAFEGEPAPSAKPLDSVTPKVREKAKLTSISVRDGAIYVDECGAKANDDLDDGDVIRAAVEKAASMKNVKVVFSEGTYILSPQEGTPLKGGYYLTLQDTENVTLEGNQTQFLFTDQYCGGIMIKNSKAVTLQGLTIDYEKAPFSQGEVVAVDKEAGTFDYKLMEGYETILDPRMSQVLTDAFGVVLQKDNPYLQKASAPNFFRISQLKKKADGVYTLQLQDPYKSYVANESQIAVGDLIGFNNRGVVGTMFRVEGCDSPTIKDCTVYSTPGTVVTATYYTGTFTIDGLKAMRKPDSDRWLVAAADGIHIQGGRGPLVVQNSHFEGLMDDCVNIYQFPAVVQSVESDTAVRVTHAGNKLPQPGDTVAVTSLKTGTYKGKAKVKSVQGDEVTFETPIAGMEGGTGYTGGDLLFVDELKFPGSVFENNVFRQSRRYGIMFRTKDMRIENNQFIDLGGAGVTGYFGPDGEGPGAENVVIKSNLFQNCGFIDQDYHGTYGAPVRLVDVKNGNQPFSQPVNFNVEISGNTITGTNRYGIALTATDGAVIKDNTITATRDQNIGNGNISGIFVETSKNVTISGNTIKDPRPELKSGIEITNKNEMIMVGENHLELAAGVPQVMDKTSGEYSTDYFAGKAGSLTIDGDFADWDGTKEFLLDQPDQVRNFKTPWSMEELSGESFIRWDDRFFYMFTKVKDDTHDQKNDAANLWKADSIQIAFDTARDFAPGTKGYTEITYGMTNDGQMLYTAFKSQSKTTSTGQGQVKLAVSRDEAAQVTNYEIAIPWTEIFESTPDVKPEKKLGFSMLINDADGGDRKGWIEYNSGIGSGKDPLSYGNLFLVEKAPEAEPEPPQQEIVFADLGLELDWAMEAVQTLAQKGIVQGKGMDAAGKVIYAPYDNVSRAEFVKLITGILDLPQADYRGTVADIEEDDWYAPYIQAALDADLIDQPFFENGAFLPDQAITREEMTALIVKAYQGKKKGEGAMGAPVTFADKEEIAPWAVNYVGIATGIGVIKGVGDNRFAPKDNADRAQAATILYRLFQLL